MTLHDATLVVENRLPSNMFDDTLSSLVFSANELSIDPSKIVKGLFLPGIGRWESGLLIASLIELSLKANDEDGRWVGFTLDDEFHRLVAGTMAVDFRQAPKCADGVVIDLNLIVERAASELGSLGFIETKSITAGSDEEGQGGTTATYHFATNLLIEELMLCFC